MKKLYFGSNLKMYKGISATREYLQKLVENTKDISRDDIELFIIPSYTTLQTATSCCNRECKTWRSEYVLGRPGTVYRRDFTMHVRRDGAGSCDDRTL